MHSVHIYSLADLNIGHWENWPSLILLLKDFPRKNTSSLNDLYGHTLAKEPLPWGLKIYNFNRPLFGHHYYILNLSDLYPGLYIYQTVWRKYINFSLITPNYIPKGGGLWNLQFTFPTNATFQIWSCNSNGSHELLRWPKNRTVYGFRMCYMPV